MSTHVQATPHPAAPVVALYHQASLQLPMLYAAASVSCWIADAAGVGLLTRSLGRSQRWGALSWVLWPMRFTRENGFK